MFAMFPSWLKSMPKSGGWMNVIKVVLGFLELAFAFFELSGQGVRTVFVGHK